MAAFVSGCSKGHVHCLNSHCEGVINPHFPLLIFLRESDFNVDFGTIFIESDMCGC